MENTFAHVLRGSFRKWCCLTNDRKETFKKLGKEVVEMIDTAFGELKIYGPGPMYTWYVRNHMKYGKIRNEQLILGMRLAQEYLSDYAHGRLKITIEEKNGHTGEAAKRPAEDGRTSSNARRLPIDGQSKK